MAFDGDDNEQVRTWEDLYDRVREILLRFGNEDGERTADCWIDEDNWGYRQHKIYVRNLKMLQPHVVKAIQRLLPEFPDWEIMVAVSVPGPGDAWPDMGITIRAHEIIDGLQRQYFPREFRDIAYEGSRPGTERD
jgi:hypothetical protein